MWGKSLANVTLESCDSGPLPERPLHEHRAGHHGGRLKEDLVAREVLALVDPANRP